MFKFAEKMIIHIVFQGSNICLRHNLLFNTIGVLPEEIDVYNLVLCLIFSSHVILLLLTMMELYFFYLYNSKFHPFCRILIKEGSIFI